MWVGSCEISMYSVQCDWCSYPLLLVLYTWASIVLSCMDIL